MEPYILPEGDSRLEAENKADIMKGSQWFTLPEGWDIEEEDIRGDNHTCVYTGSHGISIAVHYEPDATMNGRKLGKFLIHAGTDLRNYDDMSGRAFADRYEDRFDAQDATKKLAMLIELSRSH